MHEINHLVIEGYVAAAPEVFITPDEKQFATFPLAHTRKEGKKKITDFHKIIAGGHLANYCADNLVKGSYVAITGKIENRSYETKDGDIRYLTQINAETIGIEIEDDE